MSSPNQEAVRPDGSGPGIDPAGSPAKARPAPTPPVARPGTAGGEPAGKSGGHPGKSAG
jgi:hypothetical protein